MKKIDWLKNSIFVALPVLTLILINTYNSNENTEDTKNISKLSHSNLSVEDSKEEMLKLGNLLADLKNSLNGINEKIDTNKAAGDMRIKRIEKSLEELAGSGNQAHENNEIDPELARMEEQLRNEDIAIQQVNTFNNALAEEERDEAWATEMEETIWMAKQGEYYEGSNFDTPSCKTTFCRMEAYHKDEESRDKFENIRRKIPNSFHIQHYEEGDTLKSVIYFIKKGEEPNNVIFKTLNGEGAA